MIHNGRFEGRFMPSSKPVTIAEPSVSVGSCFNIYFVIAHSKNTQAATLVRQTITEPNPKYRNETSRAGISAITTPNMLRSTVSLPCACGERETTSFPIFLFNVQFIN